MCDKCGFSRFFVMSKTDEIKQKFEEEVEKIRNLEKGLLFIIGSIICVRIGIFFLFLDHGKCLVNMRQLESQLTENNMVKEVGSHLIKIILVFAFVEIYFDFLYNFKPFPP